MASPPTTRRSASRSRISPRPTRAIHSDERDVDMTMRNATLLGLALTVVVGCGADSPPQPAPRAAEALFAVSYRPSAAEREIAAAQAAVSREPGEADAYARLAGAFLERYRQTADQRHLARARDAADAAVKLGPNDPPALIASALLLREGHR